MKKVLVSANFNYGIGVFCIGRWKLSFLIEQKKKRCHEARGERSDL